MAAADQFKLDILSAIIAQGNLLSLHSGDPGKTGASELTNGAGGYARKTFAWGAVAIVSGGADDGKAKATGATTLMNVPGGTAVTHYGVRKSDGTFLYGKPMSPGATLTADGVIDVTPTHTYDLT